MNNTGISLTYVATKVEELSSLSLSKKNTMATVTEAADVDMYTKKIIEFSTRQVY